MAEPVIQVEQASVRDTVQVSPHKARPRLHSHSLLVGVQVKGRANESVLTFRVLRSLAGTLQTRLLALLHTWIACQEARLT
jgi:hypothetical protein